VLNSSLIFQLFDWANYRRRCTLLGAKSFVHCVGFWLR